jgi:hypothetical protein
MLICIVLIPVNSIVTNRTYLKTKDFLSGLKGGEFTIYDSPGKSRQYRMESKFGVSHDVRVFSLPSKKLVGRLKAKVSILDNNINGRNSSIIRYNIC